MLAKYTKFLNAENDGNEIFIEIIIKEKLTHSNEIELHMNK